MEFRRFNQSDFVPEGWTTADALLDDLGFAYVPTQCLSRGRCGIHVHYHPCGGSVRAVSTSYSLENGLPQYAESSRLVILYPQSAVSGNPVGSGCFDWYGATNLEFDTRAGAQLVTVANMLARIHEIVQS